jgi:replicative DNA helicase
MTRGNLALVTPAAPAAVDTPAQSLAAAADERAALDQAALDAIALPWPSVDALVGDLAPGRLTIVTAATGNGKTTFLLNVVSEIAHRSRRECGLVQPWTYLGTEMSAAELWRTWAAMLEGVPPGIATAAAWHRLDMAALQRIDAARRWLAGDAAGRLSTPPDVAHAVEAREMELTRVYGPVCQFLDHDAPTVSEIETAVAASAARGATLVVVDHAGRIEAGDTYDGKKRAYRRLRELAKAYRVHLLVAVQQNREARKGSRLASYLPPTLVGLEGGGYVEHEATCVIGVWRPIRTARPDEDPKTYAQLRREVEAGERPLSDVLEKNTVGVVLLKHRAPPLDAHPGMETRLRVHHGRITDPAARRGEG